MIFDEIDKLKAEIDKLRPFEGPTLQQLKAYYKIGLTYSSNALEGNSLTESETKVILEDGLTVGGKPLRDMYEAIGHANAYDHIYSLLQTDAVTEQDILTLHKLFYGLVDSAQAGIYRTENIIISGSQYPTAPPAKIVSLMATFSVWLAENEHKLHPAAFAAKAHKEFVFIHPFIDGNGRVARLLLNLCLMRRGYTIVIIPPVLRSAYINLLEKAHAHDQPFVTFIAERILETQRDLLRLFNVTGQVGQ